MIIFAIFAFSVLIILIISLIKRKQTFNFLKMFDIKSIKVFSLLIFVAIIITSSLTIINFNIFNNRELKSGDYEISARVKEITVSDNSTYLLLDNVVIDNQSKSYNIEAVCGTNNFKVGDHIKFSGYLSKKNLITNKSINTNIIKLKTFYYVSIDDDSLQISNGKASFVDGIKDRSKTILAETMSEENSGFAFATIFGDKSLLSDEYYDIFKNAGLAHILAVSGMHIGFLVAIITGILQLCKVKKKYRFIAVAITLLFYNILCNFAPSVFRASVMSLCLLLGLVLGERNDSLSNISLAGIIILIVQPLYFFDVGFLLSFSSVVGILMFSKPISKLFGKLKFPKFLNSSMSLTISATIGTIPFVCKYFAKFAPISIVSNLIVIPIFSLMFSVLLISLFANLIFNLPFMLTISNFFVNVVANMSLLFAKFGMINTINFDNLSILIYYTISFIASKFVMMTAKSKILCSLSLIVLLCSTLSIFNINQEVLPDIDICATKTSSNGLIFKTDQDKIILSGIDGGPYRFLGIKSMLNGLRLKKIDYLLVFNYKDTMQDNICEIAKNYAVDNIIVFGEYDNNKKFYLANTIYFVNNIQFSASQNIQIDNFTFTTFDNGESTKAVCFKLGETKFLQILQNLTKTEIANYSFFRQTFNFCLANTIYDKYLDLYSSLFLARRGEVTTTTKNLEFIDRSNLWTYKLKYVKI